MTVTVIDIMGTEYDVDISPLHSLEVIQNKISDATGLEVGSFIALREGDEVKDGDQIIPGDRIELDVSQKVKATRELQQANIPMTMRQLLKAVREENHQQMTLLLDAQINVDTRALIYTAINAADLPSIQILRRYGYLDNLENFESGYGYGSYEALIITVQNGDIDIFKYFLKLDCVSWSDADLIQGVFSEIIKANRPSFIDPLMSSGLIGCDSSTDTSNPLIEASKKGTFKLVERLIRQGFDPNFSTLQAGKTAFLAAARNDNPVRIMKLLVQHGANPKSKNDTGETALHIAAKKGTITKCGRYLTEEIGLSLTEEDYNGFTPKMLVKGPIVFEDDNEPDTDTETDTDGEGDAEERSEEENIQLPDFPDIDEPVIPQPPAEPEVQPLPAVPVPRPQDAEESELEGADDDLYREAAARTTNNDNGNCSLM
eukprot:TRINITY_DN6943_c1_g2_i1.p1 TRINITY_DN6943_c1_g2~~TRINITY_DN6943_c1_g2_i1.p1  ORF type:complete len:430 (+),score=102.70 TRINITY_DN6943_c1_g2_i1:398-1687(+)